MIIPTRIDIQLTDISGNPRMLEHVLFGLKVFELYVWEGPLTENMINMTKRLLELYNDKEFIEKDLQRHGISNKQMPHALDVTSNKAIEDEAFYHLIKDAVNNSVKVSPDKIADVWTNGFQKSYQFIVA